MLKHDLEDVPELIDERLDLLLAAARRLQERLLDECRDVPTVGVDELVEITVLLGDEILELLPLARDDLEVAVVLDLPNEEDHVPQSDASLVERECEGCGSTGNELQ